MVRDRTQVGPAVAGDVGVVAVAGAAPALDDVAVDRHVSVDRHAVGHVGRRGGGRNSGVLKTEAVEDEAPDEESGDGDDPEDQTDGSSHFCPPCSPVTPTVSGCPGSFLFLGSMPGKHATTSAEPRKRQTLRSLGIRE